MVTWRAFTAREMGCQVGLPARGHLKLVIVWKCGGGRRTFGCPPLYCSSLSVADCQQDAGSSSCCLASVDPGFLPLRCLAVSRKEGGGLGDSMIDGVHQKCWTKCVCVCVGGLPSSVSPPRSEFSQSKPNKQVPPPGHTGSHATPHFPF